MPRVPPVARRVCPSTEALLAAAVVAALAPSMSAQQQYVELPGRTPTHNDATHAVVLGDVDGDGDLDVVCGNGVYGPGPLQNRLYINDGSGTLTDATAARMPVLGDRTQCVVLGDVDGDGDLDLIAGNFVEQNRLLLNDGTGTFGNAVNTRMPVDSDATWSVALGDVDGDADLDLVCGNASQNRLYINDGSGTFTDRTATQLPADNDWANAVVLGDVDGDGDLDLICGNGPYGAGQQNRLYLNDGAGSFVDVTPTQLPVDNDLTESVALGDVDGDGDLDLVCGNCGFCGPGQQNRLYLNDGAGVFVDATGLRLPADIDSTRAVAFGDVDGDGDLDLVCGNGSYGAGQQNRLYLNDGAGVFIDASAARMSVANTNTMSVVLGDIDGDGDQDLVCGDYYTQNRLYLNLRRQLETPQPPTVGQVFTLDAYARYGPSSLFDVAVPYLSTDRISVPLAGYGTLGIDPMLALPATVIPQPAGVTSISWSVPNMPTAIGVSLYAQALIVSWPLDAKLTNVTMDVVR